MATVGYCSNYGPCGTANAKNVVDLKSNRDHCPNCGMTLHAIADLEPLLVAAGRQSAAAEQPSAQISMPEPPAYTAMPEAPTHTAMPEPPVRATVPDAPAPELPPLPSPVQPRSPRTEHFSDPAPAAHVAPAADVADEPAPPRSAPNVPKNVLIGAAALVTLLVVGVVAWMLVPRGAASTVAFRLCGTDALQGRLGADLVQGFLTSTGGTKVESSPLAGGESTVAAEVGGSPTRVAIHSGGSAAAYALIASGACQVAITGRAPNATELAKIRGQEAAPPAGFAQTLARDGIVIVVNPLNHVDRLSLDAVRRIFTGEITNWSAVGGENLPIAIVAPANGSDVTDTFDARVLHGGRITEAAKRVASLRLVSGAVAHDRNAIGLVTFSDSSPAKTVALETPNHGYVAPSDLSIGTTYPLSVRFGVYVPSGSNPVADRFVNYLASDDAHNAIGNAGFVPASR